MLNASQLQALKTHMLTIPELQAAIAAGDDMALAAYYNAEKTPAFVVWRTRIMPAEYVQAITWTEVDTLTVGKARIWEWLTSNQSQAINAALLNVRQGISDAFASAATTRTALTALAKRNATVLETLFATGTGTTATPATLVIEGAINYAEISHARSM
jgi:hypothetical protein